MGCKAPGMEDIIKFGGTGKCPFCRADEYCKSGFKEIHGMTLLALLLSEDWRKDEQNVLNLAGKPCRGKEWFDSKQSRLEWALTDNVFLPVDESEKGCRKLVNRFFQG